uniref:BLOC-1-related complex subunit 7 n=1 Tax=Gopherus evgoodei TaxID=1825980 RepID=A0A8C4W187_9SAUR
MSRRCPRCGTLPAGPGRSSACWELPPAQGLPPRLRSGLGWGSDLLLPSLVSPLRAPLAALQRIGTQRLLGHAARNMVMQEDAILHSEDSLRKMAIITTHLQYQQEAIQKNVEHSSNLQDQLRHLLK